MIQKAKVSERPIIFVTGETKVDWWWYSGDPETTHGQKLGPRPELIHEFRREAQQDFHLYSAASFMEFGKLDLNKEQLDPKILEEVREVGKETSIHNLNFYKRRLYKELIGGSRMHSNWPYLADVMKNYNSTMDQFTKDTFESLSPAQRAILKSMGKPMQEHIIQELIKNSATKIDSESDLNLDDSDITEGPHGEGDIQEDL